MGSGERNSRLSSEFPPSSCIIGHNALAGKKPRKEQKKRNIRTNQQSHKRETMQVKVHYISLVKSYTNKSQDDVSLNENATLSDLLDQIAQTYGKQFTAEVYDSNKKEMKQTFVAMVNGILMEQLQGMKTPLKNGDSVILMSLMTGG